MKLRDQDIVSIVIPVWNEKTQIIELRNRLNSALEGLENPWEVLFVDDGSTDGTDEILQQISKEDPRYKYLRFSRNFGHQIALTAGLDHAKGGCVISLDGDLQHPPELIPVLVKHWREGYDVVYTLREATEGATWFKKVTAKMFYWIFDFLSEVYIDPNTADFRLLDRTVVNVLRNMRERDRFLRGMVNWVGFKRKAVPFVASERFGGESKYNFAQMFAFAINGLISFSSVPLKLSIALGVFVSFISVIYGCHVFYEKVVLDIAIPGWTSILLTIIILGSMQLLTSGVICLYIGKIYNETKQRPLYILEDEPKS